MRIIGHTFSILFSILLLIVWTGLIFNSNFGDLYLYFIYSFWGLAYSFYRAIRSKEPYTWGSYLKQVLPVVIGILALINCSAFIDKILECNSLEYTSRETFFFMAGYAFAKLFPLLVFNAGFLIVALYILNIRGMLIDGSFTSIEHTIPNELLEKCESLRGNKTELTRYIEEKRRVGRINKVQSKALLREYMKPVATVSTTEPKVERSPSQVKEEATVQTDDERHAISLHNDKNKDPTEAKTVSHQKALKIEKREKTVTLPYIHITDKIAVISLLLVFSIIINLLLLSNISSYNSQVAELQWSITELERDITKKEASIHNLKSELNDLQQKAKNYDTISYLRYGNIGYGSKYFKADQSLIVIGDNEKSRTFTLTTSRPEHMSITMRTSSTCAEVKFTEDSWYDTTKIRVTPNREGVTVVTFSSDNRNDEDFMVVIIVY